MPDQTLRALERNEHRDPHLAEKALRARLRTGLPEIKAVCRACFGTGNFNTRRLSDMRVSAAIPCTQCDEGKVAWPIEPDDLQKGPGYKGKRGTRLGLAAQAGHLGARAYLGWPIAKCPRILDPYHPRTLYVPARAAWTEPNINVWILQFRQQPLDVLNAAMNAIVHTFLELANDLEDRNGNLKSVYERYDREGYLIEAARVFGQEPFLKAVCPALIDLALDGIAPPTTGPATFPGKRPL
jgi:hypothetical protein